MANREPNPHYVSIQPLDLALDESATRAVLSRLDALGRGDVVRHLGGIHIGLLAVLHDLGSLPVAEALRSSRDIRDITRSVADLETLGLVERSRERLVAHPTATEALVTGLDAHWTDIARAAREALASREVRAAEAWPAWDDLRRWLRNLAVAIAHRGLRLTRAGAIHAGDLRVLQSICDLPPSRFFDLALRVGQSMDILLGVEGSLLVGNAIDLLDLDGASFAATVLTDVGVGRVDAGHGHVSALAGLLTRWATALEPLEAQPGALRLLGPMGPEPTSDFLGEPPPAWRTAAWTALGEAHLRVRAGLIGLIGQLPLGEWLPTGTLCALAHAHIALDLLRRPCRLHLVGGGPEPVVLAAATHALPAMAARIREHLPAWLRALWTPLGAAFTSDNGASIALRYRAPGLLESLDGVYVLGMVEPRPDPSPSRPPRGGLVVQPTGEVLAAPDVSIHGVIHAAQGAELVRLGDVVALHISRRSLMRALQSGMDVRAWGEAVVTMARRPLPSTVSELIEDVARRQGELTLLPAGGVLVARDPIRLDELLSHPRVQALGARRLAPGLLMLPHDADLNELLDLVHELGFAGTLMDPS